MSRKESALDLAKFIDKGVRVKLAGGREGKPNFAGLAEPIVHCRLRTPFTAVVQGVLKGYDQLLNLVMDESIEYLRGKQSRRLPCGLLSWVSHCLGWLQMQRIP